MIEKLIVLEDIDPVIFYGVNNANIQLIKALYPKLRIVARGNVIKVLGDEEEMCAFEENITKLEKYCAEYNSLKEEVIIDIIKGNAPQAEQTGNVIVFSVTGKPIIPRSENQLKLVEGFAGKAFHQLQLVFASWDDRFAGNAENNHISGLFRLRSIPFYNIDDDFLFQRIIFGTIFFEFGDIFFEGTHFFLIAQHFDDIAAGNNT